MAEPMCVDDETMRMRKGKGVATDATEALDSSPWVEKYRPKTLADVAAHKDIIDTISRLTNENRLPHLLLYGPPGTGKTSTVLAVARQLYGQKDYANMTLELNASDDRGIDFVRKQIQDFASTKRIFSSGAFKLVILDESDNMTKDAQFALRRVIEKYTRNTRFCMICNYVGKIIPALQSRCTRFRFAPLGAPAVEERISHVIRAEGVRATPDGIKAVCKLGGGDMRRTLNILQSTHMAAGAAEVDEAAVYSNTGNPLPADIQQILKWLLNDEFSTAYRNIQEMQEKKGLALVDITRELTEYVFRMNIPTEARMEVVDALADLEHRLLYATSETLQLGALVAAFTTARTAIVNAAQ